MLLLLVLFRDSPKAGSSGCGSHMPATLWPGGLLLSLLRFSWGRKVFIELVSLLVRPLLCCFEEPSCNLSLGSLFLTAPF